jgi:hypothetical protein
MRDPLPASNSTSAVQCRVVASIEIFSETILVSRPNQFKG